MTAFFQSVLSYFVAAADSELAQQIQYLKIENEILRSKLPKRIAITPCERNRLLHYGKLVGTAISQLISIVTLRTFQRWLHAENAETQEKPPRAKVGRPKTDEEIRELILRLARESHWGYTRILGELRKLGVTVSRSTVVNILREAGIDPQPERNKGTWHAFLKRHISTLWACDFFTQKICTSSGLVDCFVLFFIHLGSRRVIRTGMTTHPDASWVLQQARNFVRMTDQDVPAPTHLLHDFDSKFTHAFDAFLRCEGIEPVKVGPAAPNLNAYAERFVLSIKSECLDHFIVFGEQHLRYLIDEYLAHYNAERPHQGVGNVPLTIVADDPPVQGEVVCDERLGGLLRHYRRQAA